MGQPVWYGQLNWEGPYDLSGINANRSIIPDFPGCYAFTVGRGSLLPRRVLYVGEAKTGLAQRLPTYLVDWRKPKAVEGHKGKGFVLEARAKHGDHGVFVRWVRYGGDVSLLEASLIDYLAPQCNDRDESVRVGTHDYADQLDSRLLMPKP